MEINIKIGIVAPEWLREPLTVLLQAATNTSRWGFETNVEALLAVPGKELPDVVLLYVCEPDDAASQVTKITSAWPHVRCVALVEQPQEQDVVKAAGADLVLPQGITPRRLLQALVERT